jgi:hypothetical protein
MYCFSGWLIIHREPAFVGPAQTCHFVASILDLPALVPGGASCGTGAVKEKLWPFGARIFGFWRVVPIIGLWEGQV